MEEEKEEQIDIREYIRVISKRKWTIFSVFISVMIFVALMTYTSLPIFEASVRVLIEKENPNVVSIQEVMAFDSGVDYYQTQYKIIVSRSIAREVIKRLSLETSEEFKTKYKTDPISRISRSISETVQIGKKFFLSLIETQEEGIIKADVATDVAFVSGFISRITVEPVKGSRLVDIKYEAKDPQIATSIANTIAKVYIDHNLETKLKAAKDAVQWLHERIEDERKKVEVAELKLIRYKESQNIVTDFSSDVENITAQKLAQLNTQVVDAESRRVESETRYKQALELKKNPEMLDSIPEVLNNDLVRQIKQIEVQLYNRMSELSKKYGQKHPRMIAVQSEIDTIRDRKASEIERIINSLRNEYQVSLAKEKSLKEALTNQKDETLELNQKAIEYGVLRREAESARYMYELLIKRFRETSLTEEMKTGNIKIVDEAEVPKIPVKPKKQRNMTLAAMIGLILGISLAFLLEFFDNTLKIPDDIRQYLKIPYLGPVPSFDIETKPIIIKDKTIQPELITIHSPKSTASESYRGIRTSILFSSATSVPKVILVTSAGPSEGKTITSTNLAITMAQAGSKVILVDCDMRKPKVHKMFGMGREKGMSSILVGSDSIEDVTISLDIPIYDKNADKDSDKDSDKNSEKDSENSPDKNSEQKTDQKQTQEIQRIDLIPCGHIPPNPSEILGSERMQAFLNALKEKYDRIIIDSPPITAVTDSIVLSKFVDGVILVVHAGETPKQLVISGLQQLASVNAHVLGAILNDINMGKESYYYYQYYYYYYGEDGDRKKKKRHKRRSSKRYGS